MIKYIDALNTIKKAAKFGILQYGKDKNHVLVYFSQGKHNPEGWYDADLDYVAKDLMRNEKAFNMLQEKIKEKLETQTLDEKIKTNTEVNQMEKIADDNLEK